jgi:CO/xanthine dehydrogenase FAD-binding subunit
MGSEDRSLFLVAHRSRSRIRPFGLYRPSNTADAIAIFQACGGPGKATYLAGGLDLIDRFKEGLHNETVIHLAGISGLADITEEDGDLTIGACVTHAHFAADSTLKRLFPALAREWGRLANPRVRAAGTIGGNLMAKNRDYDGIAVVLAADAELNFAQISGVVTRKPNEPHHAAGLLIGIRIRQAHRRKIIINRRFRPMVAFALSSYERSAGLQFRLAVNAGFSEPAFASIEVNGGLPRLREADAAAVAHELVASLPSPLDNWQASAHFRKDILRTLVRRDLLTRWA